MSIKADVAVFLCFVTLIGATCPALFAQQANQQTKTTTAPTTTRPANTQPADEIVQMSPFIVVEEKDDGYRASNSIGGTKVNTPIREIPMDIQVINENFMKDIGAIDSTEMLQYQANVKAGDRDTELTSFTIRGFKTLWQYREGVRRYDMSDAVNIARAEVVAGPAAIFYGYSQPGGLINIVNKKPSFGPTTMNLDYTYGSYDFNRVTLDTNTVLYDKVLAGRLMYSYTNNNSYREWETTKRSVLATVFAIQVSPKLSLNIDLEHLKQDAGYGHGKIQDKAIDKAGVVTWLPQYLDVDMKRQWTGPDGKSSYEAENLIVTANYKINENMYLRLDGSYYDRSQKYMAYIGQQVSAMYDPAGNMVKDNAGNAIKAIRARIAQFDNGNDVRNFHADFIGKFETGPIQHQILAGASYTLDHQAALQNWDRTMNAAGTKYNDNWRYWRVDDLTPDLSFYHNSTWKDPMFSVPTFHVNTNMDSSSLYLHYKASAFDRRVMVIAGARYDDVNYWSTNFLTKIKQDEGQSEVSPQLGFLVKALPCLYLYGLHSTSLDVPPFQSNSIGEVLPNRMGSSIEGGVKFDFFDGRVSGALSIYNIKLKNIALTDPNIPNLLDPSKLGEVVTVGEQTSEGFDFSVNCSPFKGYQITAGWAYVDTYISKDTNPANIGRAISPLPYNRGTFWNNYRFTSGRLSGLSMGAGVAWTDSRVINAGTSWTKPDGTQARADAFLTASAAVRYSFRIGKMNLNCSLNISNLTDELDEGGMSFLQPRSYRLMVSTHF